MINSGVPKQPLRETRTMALRPNHEQISRRANLSSCSSVSAMTSRRKSCTLTARLPRCCSKNFKVKTGSEAEKDPDADPPIEDETQEPANEAVLAVTDGLCNPEAELAEAAPPKAEPAMAVATKLVPELSEMAVAVTALLASDADTLAGSVASINIEDQKFKLIAEEMLMPIIKGKGDSHLVVYPTSQISE
jgi:hypothetical protein